MDKEIKERIAAINSGIIPEGYKKTKVGIVPVEWEDTHFSELFIEKKNVTSDFEKYPLYSLTIEEGVVPKSERYERSHLVKKDDIFKIVSKNDFVYNPMNVRFGALARYKGQEDVSVSGYYDIFSVKESVSKEYMENFLLSEPMINYYNKVSTGSLKEKQRVHFSQFLDFVLPIPPLPEQQKIAEILSTQDKLIELQEKKIEQLKELKKAYLQKMFPQKGSNYPELRFKGFTDPWEQRKLGECVTFLDTMRKPLKESEREKGIYPYYGASGIVDYVSDYIFDEELVLLSEDGANITDRNYPVCFLASGKYWVNNHAHVLKVNAENENNFICNSLERMDFTQYNSGMAMPKLNKDVCHNIPLFCPIFEEQKQIGDFFRNLDTLITLHQRKSEQEKQKKKALMQLLLTGIVRTK